jgi:tryptophanyl-tRNA synthetase
MSIYCSLTGSTLRQIEDDFAGKGYGHLKSAVAEAVIETLAPIQSEYARFMSDKGALDQIINNGAARARSLADRTMATVRKKVGLAPM